MGSRTPSFDEIQETLKKTAAALNASGVDFVLAGGVACWARGGAPSATDLDYMVRPRHAERALEALVEAGLHAERPPEEWLLKAWDGDVLVDLIFEPMGLVVDDELFERSTKLDVLGVPIHVMLVEDVLVARLLAMHEHYLDLEPLIDIARLGARADRLGLARRRTESSPYARAFLVIVEGLGISGEAPEDPSHPAGLTPEDWRSSGYSA